MNPEGRCECRFERKSKGNKQKTEYENQKDGRPIGGIVFRKVKAAYIATVIQAKIESLRV